jgi:hypothetical protein
MFFLTGTQTDLQTHLPLFPGNAWPDDFEKNPLRLLFLTLPAHISRLMHFPIAGLTGLLA